MTSPAPSSGRVRFVRFVSIGAACVALNVLIFWTASTLLQAHYAPTTVFAFLAVNFVGYRLNRRFTFANPMMGAKTRLHRYYVAMLGSLAVNLLMMLLLIDVAKIPVVPASVIVSVLLTFFNYIAHARWTFLVRHDGRIEQNDA